MTTEEFSNEFDVLLNSYSTIEEFGKVPSTVEFDEYEKSVFLTEAQESLVRDIYSGRNLFGLSFESTEEARSYLRNLIKTYTTSEEVNGTKLTNNSVLFKLPDDLWFITYESVDLGDNLYCDNKNITVVPITQDELHRVKNNPFRGSGKRRVLRVDVGNNIVEIISRYSVYSYTVKYLSKPKPIVLVDLPSDLYINDINKRTECVLNPVIHRAILERAVNLALISRGLNTGSNK